MAIMDITSLHGSSHCPHSEQNLHCCRMADAESPDIPSIPGRDAVPRLLPLLPVSSPYCLRGGHMEQDVELDVLASSVIDLLGEEAFIVATERALSASISRP